jgi:protein SCO1/2
MNKKYLFGLITLFILGLLLSHTYSSNKAASDTAQIQAVDLQSIEFHGQNEKQFYPFDVNDSRTRILYFGFTKCPDVCPTSLAVLSGALHQLSATELEQFRPIFISLDPERDLASNTHAFAGYFHGRIEGMVTSLEQTAQLANYYGVFYKKVVLDKSRLDYTLDHTSYFYFVEPDGTLIEKVPHTMTPAPLLDVMKTLSTSRPVKGQ